MDTEEVYLRYADAALALLPLMMPADEAAEVAARITEALGRSDHRFFAVAKALRSHPVLRELFLQQQPPTQHRSAEHFLDVEAPAQVPVGHEFSVEVAVTGTPLGQYDRLNLGDSTSRELTVVLKAPGFEPAEDSNWRQKLPLPSGTGSSRIEFGLRSRAGGRPEAISVRAYAGGTQVGEVTLAVAAGPRADPVHVKAGLSGVERNPRDARLEVTRVGERLAMSVSHETDGEEVLTGPVSDDALTWLTSELSVLATGETGAAERRLRLRELGAELWMELFPGDIRDQLRGLPPEVTSLHVRSDGFSLPFELVHPVDPGGGTGFLVERFDVARPAGGTTVPRRGRPRQAAFVRPENAPANADQEFDRVTAALGAGTRVWPGRVTNATQMSALLTLPTTLIHIAAHLEMDLALRFPDGGRFDHRSLASAIGAENLAAVAPVVLFNGCDSATALKGIIEPSDWGRRFVAAGAGAFIGTLWPVTSGPATTFAESFHHTLVQPGSTVGQAMRAGRTAVRDKDGDAAWLAYTLYGDPAYGTA
ncbi:CHAT domain-containing protein [Actinoplanes awajinensis]|uniref:CHAT domain-containing protein n=1 Tax=Actinoplanes awajinensis subsp. mycoplanecinus TaxID=135947 RepID=A0A101J7C6_9ACTN|nr:CHAT domain-containing protein [Actinoplanes awajinensis]KUL21589.1 hypothetical protein ADL15_50365 [Actinoplanes awajinensis subsp. mycoplanecinus]